MRVTNQHSFPHIPEAVIIGRGDTIVPVSYDAAPQYDGWICVVGGLVLQPKANEPYRRVPLVDAVPHPSRLQAELVAANAGRVEVAIARVRRCVLLVTKTKNPEVLYLSIPRAEPNWTIQIDHAVRLYRRGVIDYLLQAQETTPAPDYAIGYMIDREATLGRKPPHVVSEDRPNRIIQLD